MATGGELPGRLTGSSGFNSLSQPICQPCLETDNIVDAVGICADCEDYVCSECFKGHKEQQHRLLDRDQVLHGQTQANHEDFCTDSCPVHENEVIQYYCTSHCHLGCKTCITLNHTMCNDVQCIPQIAIELSTNEDYKQIESQLKSVMATFINVFRKSQRNSDKLNQSCADSLKRLQECQRQVDEILGIIERVLVEQLHTLRLKADREIAELRSKYKAAYRELQASQARIEALQRANYNCDSYTEMMRIKEKLKSLEDLKQKAGVDNSYRKGDIQFTENRQLMQLLSTPEGFGSVYSVDTQNIVYGSDEVSVLSNTETSNVTSGIDDLSHDGTGSIFSDDFSIITDQELSTHSWIRTVSIYLGSNTEGIISGSQVYHVLDLKVKTERDISRCSITGMEVLPDGRLVLTDSLNNSLKLVNVKNNQGIPQLQLTFKPWDITTIQRNNVAVTLPFEQKIAFVTVGDNDMSIARTLDMDGQCRGIDHRNGRLAVSFCDPDKVQILSLEGSVLYSIDNNSGQVLFSCPRFLTFGLDDTTLYVSNVTDHSVLCVNLDGTVVAAYKDMNLKYPAKAVVDSNGNVYVCDYGSHTIYQITKDFKTVRLQLQHADGVDRPKSICLSEEEDTLYVWMLLS